MFGFMRGCVAYIYHPDLTLTFDLKVNFIGFCRVFVFDPLLLFALTLAYHIWQMGLSPREDVLRTFMILIR